MCRPANGCRFPNDRARTGAAGKPAQSLVFLGCRGSSKAGRLHSLPRCQNYGPLAPGLDGPRLRALGTTVRPYQSPALVNARLPGVNWAAGKVGGAAGWLGGSLAGAPCGKSARLSSTSPKGRCAGSGGPESVPREWEEPAPAARVTPPRPARGSWSAARDCRRRCSRRARSTSQPYRHRSWRNRRCRCHQGWSRRSR